MKRGRMTALVIAALGIGALPLLYGGATATAGNTPRPAGGGDAPTVGTMATMLEQFRWGTTHLDVIRTYNQTGGLFDQEYNPRLAKLQPGVAMQAVEAERDQKKKFFEQSYIQFLDTPTGFDNTSIKGEYTYRNHESVMYVDRLGKRRYFFFFGTPPSDRLWKILDDIPLKADGPLGRTYQEAVTKLNVQLSTPARIRPANPSQGLNYTTADWQDGSTHLRAEDRGQSVVVVLEDRATLSSLGQLRANKDVDPLAMDPSIQAITHGGISDPNATRTVDAGAPRRR